MRRGVLTLFAIGLALVTAGIALGPIARAEDDAPVAREDLISLLRGVRLTEGALHGFPDAPVEESAPPSELIARSEFRELYLHISRVPYNRRNSDWLANAALIDLVNGDLDSAIDHLKRAVQNHPEEAAPFWSDLAAVYLERARSSAHASDLALSLAAADQALRLDPSLSDAHFNQAVVFSKLHINKTALVEWREYIRLDPDSSRSLQARLQIIHLLRRQTSAERHDLRSKLYAAVHAADLTSIEVLIRRFSQPAREFVELELLPNLGAAWLSGHPEEATRLLHTTRLIADKIATSHRDYLLIKTVEAFNKASLREKNATAEGFLKYAEAKGLLDKGHTDQALLGFLTASSNLAAVGNPFKIRAELEAQTCQLFLGQPDQALTGLHEIYLSLDTRHYRSVSARWNWLAGVSYLRLAKLESSLAAYRRALATFVELGEDESAAAMHTLIAENLRFQGEVEKAWGHRLQSLEILGDLQPTVYLHNVLFDAAEAALDLDAPRVALFFQDEMVKVATKLNDPILVTEAIMRRSGTFSTLQDLESARRDLEQIREWNVKIDDPVWRRISEADLEIAEGKLKLSANPAEAIDNFGRALELLGADAVWRLPDVYRLRALAFLADGDLGRADEDLKAALRIHERIRREIKGVSLRFFYLEQAKDVFDAVISFQADSDPAHPSLAFNTLEQARARSLLDSLGQVEPLSVDAIQPLLPEGVVLAVYSVLSDRTMVWMLARDRFYLVTIPVESSSLRQEVRLLLRTLRSPAPGEFVDVSRNLYHFLLDPVVRYLRPKETLVIVPDKFLHRLPFAALQNPRTGDYLIEHHPVLYSPSATLYIRSLHHLEEVRKIPSEQEILIVGNPSFDQEAFGGLPSLEGAEQEARQIATLYAAHRPVLLLQKHATKRNFWKEAVGAKIIHVAAHAKEDSRDPLSSYILFTKGSDVAAEPGPLYASEIYGVRLPHTALVVLAACETADGALAYGEGAASLARPFLAAGVPSVVASLWKADDKVSADIFLDFHRHIIQGQSAATALRASQLKALQSADPQIRWPRSWAGYLVLGSS